MIKTEKSDGKMIEALRFGMNDKIDIVCDHEFDVKKENGATQSNVQHSANIQQRRELLNEQRRRIWG